MALDDLNFQQLSTAQDKKQPTPVTMASAATIAPTTKLTNLTGVTEVTLITRPVSGYHELTFKAATGTANHFNTGGTATATAAPIKIAYTTVTNRPVTLYYDPTDNFYHVMTVT